jgi:hypothetical protein
MKVPRALAFGVQPSRCSFEVHAGTYEKIRENSLAYSMFGVRCSMFSRIRYLSNPHIPPLFSHFPRKSNCPQHSALMGGQFPAKKARGTFKNPIFYGGIFRGISRKNELSFLMVQNSPFYTVFPQKNAPNPEFSRMATAKVTPL